MTQFENGSRLRSRRTAWVAVAALVGLAACNTEKLLNQVDPDIINPVDLQSAAGAEALYIGSYARLNTMTSGGEGFFLYGGLLGDEFNSGDTFIERNQVDQRAVLNNNANINSALRNVQRTRVSAYQAITALKQYNTTPPAVEISEMYAVQAFAELTLAENFCNGIPLSYTTLSGAQILGTPLTTAQVYAIVVAHADSGIAALGTDVSPEATNAKYRNQIVKGRALIELGQFAQAQAAVAGVPAGFTWEVEHSLTSTLNQIWALNNSAGRYVVAQNEDSTALNFRTASDPRVPVCLGGTTACKAVGATDSLPFEGASSPFRRYAQMIWGTRTSPVTIASGTEASLIRAEALLNTSPGTTAWLDTLNALRARVTGLAPLTDPGTVTARQNLLFRERAFWLFGTGHRLPDMRRLLRAPYSRTQAQVFPTGAYPKGGTFGTDVNFPITQSEQNNPNFSACFDRNP